MSKITKENIKKHLFVKPTDPISTEWVFESIAKDKISVDVCYDLAFCDIPEYNRRFYFNAKDFISFYKQLENFIKENNIVTNESV